MENDNVITLDYLLKVKAEKKKKEPSRIERDEYCSAWVKLATGEGFTERTERYLYNGISYCGAKPFKEYLDTTENKEQTVQSFFAGKMYGTNAETTFRLLVHLFALLLNDKKATHLTPAFIMRLPSACFNKDKKKLGNIETILLKYFFAELDPNQQLIPLADLPIKKQVFIVDFIASMEDAMSKIVPTGLSKNKISNIAKVQQWFDEYRQVKAEGMCVAPKPDAQSAQSNSETVTKPENCTEHSSVGQNVPAGYDTVEKSANPATCEEKRAPETKTVKNESKDTNPSDMPTYLLELIKKAGLVAISVKAENVQLRNQIESLSKSLESEQEKLKRAKQQIEDQNEAITELRKKASVAESDIFVLKRDIAQKEVIIAEKDSEIAERIKMADVLSRDRSKQADEVLQRVAAKIKVEYRDFLDAIEVPMSCDLGENLRLQLQSVFDILEKGGMKFK